MKQLLIGFAFVAAVGCGKTATEATKPAPVTTQPTSPSPETTPATGPKAEPPIVGQRKASAQNLKQTVLGMQQYHDAFMRLPGNVTDKDGKPLLSWRVAILEFLDKDKDAVALFKSFDVTQPWDGPTNKKLIEKMPKFYAPVAGKANPGETFYCRFVGPKAVLRPGGRQVQPNLLMQDGSSNTIAVVEAGEPVIWTKPDDHPFDPAKDLPKLGGMFDGEFHVVTYAGETYRIRKDFDPKNLKAAITPDGAEVFSWDDLIAKD